MTHSLPSSSPLTRLLTGFLSVLAMPAAGYAAELSGRFDETAPQTAAKSTLQQLHDWNVAVGGGGMFQPAYEGSDEMKIVPVPFVSATVFDLLTIDPSGITLKAYEQGPLEFGIKAGYDLGRSEDDSDDLKGLGDVDFGVTAGAEAKLTYGPADFFVSVDKTLGGSDGLLGTVGVEITQPVTEQIILGAQASATFADKNYMTAYFGVNGEQAARSGYNSYKARAGLKSIELSVSATYLIDDNWTLRGEQKLGILTGDAADSPLVKQSLQPSTLLILGYRF